MKITARIEIPKKMTAKFKELKMPLSGGYDEGYEDGKEDGYTDGVKDGEAIGYEKGHADGYESGYTEGSAYYDTFWDAYQSNGTRTDYSRAFGNVGWNNAMFKPKYAMQPTTADYMFNNSKIEGDLRELATLDTSKTTYAIQMFYGANKITALGVLDLRKCGTITYLFMSASALESVELIMLKDDGSQSPQYAFNSTSALKEIRFEGVIGKAIDFKSCPLSVASMKNIIEHLKDFNGSGSENTVKVTFNDACWEALEAESTAPDGGTWKEYVQFTLCWNV